MGHIGLKKEYLPSNFAVAHYLCTLQETWSDTYTVLLQTQNRRIERDNMQKDMRGDKGSGTPWGGKGRYKKKPPGLRISSHGKLYWVEGAKKEVDQAGTRTQNLCQFLETGKQRATIAPPDLTNC